MNNKVIMIVLLFFCQIGVIKAQILKEKKLQSKGLNSRGASTLERIYKDNGKFYQLLSNNSELNSKNNNSSKSFVLKSNDSEFSFATGEIPISVTKSKVYTATYNFDTHKAGFKVYDIGNQKKSPYNKNTLELNLYSDASVLKNGDIIVTEGTENGGIDWIGLYSPTLDLIHKFTPFKNESNVVFDANENFIVYAAQVERTNLVRIALYGSFADKGFVGSQQLEIDQDHFITSIVVEGTYITLLLTGPKGNQLITFNKNLEVLHKRNLNRNVSHHKLLGVQGKLFFSSGLKVLCYDIINDVIDWEYQEEQYSLTRTKKGFKAKGGELYLLDNKHLVFAEGTYEDGVAIVKNTSLKVITCKEGKVAQKITTGDLLEKMRFVTAQNEAILFTNDKMISYEKQ